MIFFFSFLALNYSFHRFFFPKFGFSFSIKWFVPYQSGFAFVFFVFLSLRLVLSLTCSGQVIVSPTVSFLIGFHVDSSDRKIRSKVIISNLNHVHQYVVDLESYVF